MQAIVTKFVGPTNAKGSRVKAKADAGTVTIGWDYGASDGTEWNEIEANHRAAAVALMDRLGWSEYLTISGSGSLPGNGADRYVFTLTPKRESK